MPRVLRLSEADRKGAVRASQADKGPLLGLLLAGHVLDVHRPRHLDFILLDQGFRAKDANGKLKEYS